MDGGSSYITPVAPVLHNEEVEQALLGALLANNGQYDKVAGVLKAEHFFDPAHGRIYSAIGKLVERGQQANPVTLRPYFERDQDLSRDAGGAGAYLAALLAGMVTVINARDYAATIYDLWLRRQMLDMLEHYRQQVTAFDLDTAAADVLEQLEQSVFMLDEDGARSQPIKSLVAAVTGAIERAESAAKNGRAVSGVTTGFRDLDYRTGGLQPADLIFIGARPSMGKTDLGFGIAKNAARAYADGDPAGGGVLFFSQEMAAEQLGARYLADAVSIAADRQRRGEVSADDFARMRAAVRDLPIWIDDTPRITPAHVMRVAKRVQRRNPLGLIVVDHLNIMGAPEEAKGQGDTAVTTANTAGLKAVAKLLNVPVIVLSQLNRAVEMREDKRPQLSDLRQSGSIEQDADVVIFLYREQYYLERSEPARLANETQEKFNDRYQRWQEAREEWRNVAEVIVAKQRMGPIGTVKLFYDGARSLFADLDPRH